MPIVGHADGARDCRARITSFRISRRCCPWVLAHALEMIAESSGTPCQRRMDETRNLRTTKTRRNQGGNKGRNDGMNRMNRIIWNDERRELFLAAPRAQRPMPRASLYPSCSSCSSCPPFCAFCAFLRRFAFFGCRSTASERCSKQRRMDLIPAPPPGPERHPPESKRVNRFSDNWSYN